MADAQRSRMRLAIFSTGSSGRNVAGPFLMASSAVALGSATSSFSRNRPSTTRSLPTTTHLSQTASRTCSLAAPTFSAGAPVGTSGRAAYGRGVRLRALRGETACGSARLAGRVVVDLREPQAFEPRRGPWAHVSEVGVTVDDHRGFGV